MQTNPPKRARARSTLRLDDYLPYRLSVAANEVSRLVAGAYEKQFGITIPQWRILANLAEHGALTPQQVGKSAVMDKVTVSRAAQGLIQRRLLQRRENGRDGRSHILTLTAEGVRLYETIAPLALAFERALLDQWDESQIRTIHEQLKKLQQTAAVLAGLGHPRR